MSKTKWILLGGGLFLVSLIVTFLFMYYGNSLVGPDRALLYFIILIPLGLFCSSMLFYVMKSYAVLTKKNLRYSLILRGPVVVFALVMYGGYYFLQHPPPPDTYDVSIAFIDRNDKDKLLDGSATIRYQTDVTNSRFFNGKLVYTKVQKDQIIRIDPDISNYLKLKSDSFKVPKYNTTLDVYLDKDSARVAATKVLCARFYSIMYAYIYDAENLTDVIGDRTNAVLQGNQTAIDSLVHNINQYNKSYRALYDSERELLQGLKDLAGIDPITIKSLSETVDNIHSALYDQFNSSVRAPLMDYLNGKSPNTNISVVLDKAGTISEGAKGDIKHLKTVLESIIDKLPYKNLSL
jgi:hypothetical protein